MYNGIASDVGVQQAVEENSDLVLFIGQLPSDSNTGGFSSLVSSDRRIDLNPSYCSVKGKRWDGLHFKPLLENAVMIMAGQKSDKYSRGVNGKVHKLPSGGIVLQI